MSKILRAAIETVNEERKEILDIDLESSINSDIALSKSREVALESISVGLVTVIVAISLFLANFIIKIKAHFSHKRQADKLKDFIDKNEEAVKNMFKTNDRFKQAFSKHTTTKEEVKEIIFKDINAIPKFTKMLKTSDPFIKGFLNKTSCLSDHERTLTDTYTTSLLQHIKNAILSLQTDKLSQSADVNKYADISDLSDFKNLSSFLKEIDTLKEDISEKEYSVDEVLKIITLHDIVNKIETINTKQLKYVEELENIKKQVDALEQSGKDKELSPQGKVIINNSLKMIHLVTRYIGVLETMYNTKLFFISASTQTVNAVSYSLEKKIKKFNKEDAIDV